MKMSKSVLTKTCLDWIFMDQSKVGGDVGLNARKLIEAKKTHDQDNILVRVNNV